MIEEAAGTRMYESKKQSAQRTIEKKDSKLQEIETVRSSLNLCFDCNILHMVKFFSIQNVHAVTWYLYML